MGRYTKEFWDSTPGLIETVITGGVVNIVHDALNIPITFYCKITDTKSGASAVGKGATRGEASADAWFNLTGEKDERYKDNERNRKFKQEEFEKRNRERVQKQKEWEARKAERERKQREWEARKAERERKQREWEERQRERESKKREWEARKAESERRRQEYLENKRYRSGGGHRGGGGRGKKGGDGCYITTATCLTLGKDDFCSELMTFRKYRDTWLAVNHPELIKENDYPHIVPQMGLLVPQIYKCLITNG